MQRGRDALGYHAGAEPPRCAPAHPAIEDQLHLAGPPDVQVLADDLLEEDATGHRSIEHLRQRELGLQDRRLVAVPGGTGSGRSKGWGTYIATDEGWLYLAAVLGLFSRRVVGWAMAAHRRETLVNDALQMALGRRQPERGLLHHSDRGVQYACQDYQAALQAAGITVSMSRKGNCFNNAVIESFFGTLKAEYYHLEKIEGIDVLEAGVHDYIRYYNHERIKLGLKGLSPVEYRLRNPV